MALAETADRAAVTPKTDGVAPLRIAALADLHYGRSGDHSSLNLGELASTSDVFVVCGDLTDHGLPEQAQGLLKELAQVHIPIVAVLGNHDYESGREAEVQRILTEGGVTVLDGDACELHGVGFAGTKGFGGGFGRRTLEPWGERAVKAFVEEAANEAMKLEKALARLRNTQIIALLHYAPIQATVEGEPPEIFPFLGCSRLEEPLNRYGVTAVFHGHAHRGAPEGRTQTGIPVYNVSVSTLKLQYPDQPTVRRFEVPR